jgi:hypothetical protein
MVSVQLSRICQFVKPTLHKVHWFFADSYLLACNRSKESAH